MQRWRGVLAAGAVVLGMAIPAGGASAGTVPLEVRFQVTDSTCVHGTGNRRGLIIQLRNASGDILGSVPAEPEPGGRFEACFDRVVQQGNRLRAVLGSSSRSFTVPVLTVKPNRVSDIVNGTGPRNERVKVRLYDCAWRATPACVRKVTRTITIRSDGTWRRDFTPQFDARGYDRARVTFESGAGHTYTVERPFPWMRAVLDFHNGPDHPYNLWGATYSGLTRTFRLRASPGGSVLATEDTTGHSPSAQVSFFFGRTIEPGHQVTSTFADDAALNVWPVEMTVTYEAQDQFINAWCLPDKYLVIDWHEGSRRIRADSEGKASVNLDLEETQDYRLAENHQIGISCQNSRGDVVTRWFRHHYSPED